MNIPGYDAWKTRSDLDERDRYGDRDEPEPEQTPSDVYDQIEHDLWDAMLTYRRLYGYEDTREKVAELLVEIERNERKGPTRVMP